MLHAMDPIRRSACDEPPVELPLGWADQLAVPDAPDDALADELVVALQVAKGHCESTDSAGG